DDGLDDPVDAGEPGEPVEAKRLDQISRALGEEPRRRRAPGAVEAGAGQLGGAIEQAHRYAGVREVRGEGGGPRAGAEHGGGAHRPGHASILFRDGALQIFFSKVRNARSVEAYTRTCCHLEEPPPPLSWRPPCRHWTRTSSSLW